jgi:hypothetical protein
MTSYLKLIWHHEFIDEPTWLYSELDENRYEVRKVEVFKDGQVLCGLPKFERKCRARRNPGAEPSRVGGGNGVYAVRDQSRRVSSEPFPPVRRGLLITA